MKTKAIIFTILLMLTATIIQADELRLKMQDEEFINDIPFNTATIAVESARDHLFGFELVLHEEEYINDIPFSTQQLAKQHISEIEMNRIFQLEEESYIDDIPFDTAVVKSTFDKSII